MLEVITDGFSALVGFTGNVISAIFNISIGMTIVGFGISTVKNLIGRY